MWLLLHRGSLGAGGERVSGPCEGGDRAKCHSPHNPCVLFCFFSVLISLSKARPCHCLASIVWDPLGWAKPWWS